MRVRMIGPTVAVLMLLCSTQTFAGPTIVSCGPGQQAIVRDTFVRGTPVTHVECAGQATYGRPITYRSARYQTPYDRRYRHRSWAKSALIIGGSAGTGAGIGGIVRGRKGALIGAAIGGGLASIHEGLRRR